MPITLWDNSQPPRNPTAGGVALANLSDIAHLDAEIARLQAIIEAGFAEVFARIAALDAKLQTLIEGMTDDHR